MDGAISRHRRHVAKLEQIIRLMDNDHLDPNDIDGVSLAQEWRAGVRFSRGWGALRCGSECALVHMGFRLRIPCSFVLDFAPEESGS